MRFWSSSLSTTTPTIIIKQQQLHFLSPHRRTISNQCSFELTRKLVLDRRWALPFPDTKIHQVILPLVSDTKTPPSFTNNIHFPSFDSPSSPSFYVVRDDLLHPLVNGNKARKLDALLPLIQHQNVTHVVTCGGCQSAHTAALAVACAERGLKSHLLLRGEAPHITTGYNLISTMYGSVTYVPRSLYAQREQMLNKHAHLVAGTTGSVVCFSDILDASFTSPTNVHTTCGHFPTKVVIVNEGAGDTAALFGVIRLVQYLSQPHLLGNNRAVKLVVDAGTGTTAIGLGLGVVCLGLPWEVTAIMLADTIVGYRGHEKRLISEFKRCCAVNLDDNGLDKLDNGIVSWVERTHPRKFGNVMKGEVEACQQIAKQTGILVDPVYTLAAWELSTYLSQQNSRDDAKVVMLHTGGTLGMFGLAQRYKSYFHTPGALPV